MYLLPSFQAASLKLWFLLLLLHSLPSWWKQYLYFSSVNHSMTSNQDTFYLTAFLPTMTNWKTKPHTFFSKQRTKILHWAIYHLLMTITKMNKTIRRSKKQHFSIWSMRSLQCWSTFLARLQKPCSRTISLSSDLRKGEISKPHEVFLWNPMGHDTISILMMS